MKTFLEIGNRYAAKSDWKDFALTKFCLCAMGILIGINIPAKGKKTSGIIAGAVFLVTYMMLMKKVFAIIKDMMK